MAQSSTVAYFSMEVGLEPEMPTYSGGLGILAGDTLRAAADLEIPMVGVTLLHRKGYFRQHLDENGNQSESPVDWYPEEFLEPQRPRVTFTIHAREVQVRVWRYNVHGVTGWSMGDSWLAKSDASEEIASLQEKLESVMLPMFYERPRDYAGIMRSAIAINGSFFNAQRMMFQYMRNAYATTEEI
jgi:glucan phosphorylase